jgi:hypothetical protein
MNVTHSFLRATALAVSLFSCLATASAAPPVPVFSFNTVSGPEGNLTLDGLRLYGVTPASGANDQGSIWGVDLDGTDYQTLHSFLNPPNSSPDPKLGTNPKGGLLLGGSTLTGAAGGPGGVCLAQAAARAINLAKLLA